MSGTVGALVDTGFKFWQRSEKKSPETGMDNKRNKIIYRCNYIRRGLINERRVYVK